VGVWEEEPPLGERGFAHWGFRWREGESQEGCVMPVRWVESEEREAGTSARGVSAGGWRARGFGREIQRGSAASASARRALGRAEEGGERPQRGPGGRGAGGAAAGGRQRPAGGQGAIAQKWP